MSTLITSRLAEIRSRHLMVTAVVGAARALALLLLCLTVIMAVDFVFDLPLYIRAVLLAAALAAVGSIILARVVRPLRSPPDDDEVALWVERAQPELGQRLISAVQLARGSEPGFSRSMLASLHEQAELLTAPIDAGDLVRADPVLKWMGIGTALLLGLVIGLGLLGADGRDLLLRSLCVPGIEVPRKTRVDLLTPVQTIIARGEDVEINARARGIIPAEGVLEAAWSASPKRTYPVPRRTEPQPPELAGPDVFSVTLRGVLEDLTYRVRLNDGRSIEGSIRVSVRPFAQKVDAVLLPPAYTGQPRVPRPSGDLVMLEGSRLELAVESSKPVRRATLRSISGDGRGQSRVVLLTDSGPGRVYPLLPDDDGSSPRRLRAVDGAQNSIPIPRGTRGLAFLLVDDDGLETRDPTVYRVELLPDLPPTVRVVSPTRKEEVLTRQARVRVAFDVTDDIGLASLRIRYIVRSPVLGEIGQSGAGGGGGGGGAVEGRMINPNAADAPSTADLEKLAKSIELDIPATPSGPTRAVAGFYPWTLASVPSSSPDAAGLPEGTVIEWWLEAADANNVTGPGRTLSDRFLFRIGTEAQVRDSLMTRLSNSFATLSDTQQSQQSLAQDLGKLILEKPLTNPNPPTPTTRPR
jgi:hypothetical protein